MVDITASGRDTCFATAYFRKLLNTFADRLFVGITKTQAQPMAAIFGICRPFGTGVYRHTFAECHLRQVGGINTIGQGDPDKNTTLWHQKLGRCAELFFQCCDHHVTFALKGGGQIRHIPGEMVQSEFRQHHLFQSTAARVLFQGQNPAHHGPVGNQIANPQGRRD